MIANSKGGGGFLTVPVCWKIKSYEKILGELQNTCKNERGNLKKKTTFSSKSGETFNSVRKTELD